MNIIFLLLAIPYYEIIFSISTTRCRDSLSVFIMLSFSFAYSLLVLFFSRIIVNKKGRFILETVFLSIVPILYYVEFLIYRNFKVFYDINTVINGAGGALTDFTEDIKRLIFCVDGLSRLFLFYLPLFIYIIVFICVFGRETARIDAGKIKQKTIILLALIVYLIAVWIVYLNEIKANMYDREYNYQTVVENLGVITGLRLDAKRLMFGNNSTMFEIDSVNSEKHEADSVESNETDTVDTNTVDGTETVLGIYSLLEDYDIEETEGREDDTPIVEEIVYEPNEFNIDYEYLATTTTGINAELDEYVASIEPTYKNEYTGLFEGKNLIFFTAEAFSGDVIDEELTPTLYRLANNGIQFTDYLSPAIAGTTGGEYTNIFGLLPTAGGKSMTIMTDGTTFLNMGHQLDKLGYYGKAYHNNNYKMYDRNITHEKLGYSDGFMGIGNGMEEYVNAKLGFPESDLDMLTGTLPTYIDKSPFNIYYMTVSGHGQYGQNTNLMSMKNYHRVENLDKSELVKCYIANNLELEDALTYLVDSLYEKGIADDTVIVLAADHFPYNLDKDASLGNMPNLSELYGYNVTSYLQRDHNRLIIWSGCLEKMDPIVVSSPVGSIDILPTLSNLFGVEYDSRLLPGRDVFSDSEAIAFNSAYDWKTDLGTYMSSQNEFIPKSSDSVIPDGYVDRIKSTVRNKLSFCKGVLENDYYGHVYNALQSSNE